MAQNSAKSRRANNKGIGKNDPKGGNENKDVKRNPAKGGNGGKDAERNSPRRGNSSKKAGRNRVKNGKSAKGAGRSRAKSMSKSAYKSKNEYRDGGFSEERWLGEEKPKRATQGKLPLPGTVHVPPVSDDVAKKPSNGSKSPAQSVNRPVDSIKDMPTDLLGRNYETFPAPLPLDHHGPARIIAMCNQKGGVGKTTSSINIAGALSQYGRRVLIVDFDPQGAASVGLGINANTVDATIYDALFDTSLDVHDVVQHTDFENLDIIPANIDLSAAEVQLVTEVGRERILASVLQGVRDEYDVIIVDCQPSLGLLTVNALAASDGVIIPVAAEFFALRGVALLMQSIEKVRSRINPQLEVYGVLVTMYTSTLHCEEVLQRIYEAFQDKVFHSVISRSIKLPDSSVAAAPITIYAPNHKTAKEYRETARELIARGIVD